MLKNGSLSQNWKDAFIFLKKRSNFFKNAVSLVVLGILMILMNLYLKSDAAMIAVSAIGVICLIVGGGMLLRYGDIIGEDQSVIVNWLIQNEISDVHIGKDSESQECLVATTVSDFYVCRNTNSDTDKGVTEYPTKEYTMFKEKDSFSIVHKKTGASHSFTTTARERKLNKAFKDNYASIVYMKDRTFITPFTLFKKR